MSEEFIHPALAEATHRAISYIGEPKLYSYYKQDKDGNWMYFSELGMQWVYSNNSKLYFQTKLKPISK